MAHEACSKKCVKSASPCYSSVLFGFFPLVSNDGGATSTPVSQKLEGNSPPKAGSEQKVPCEQGPSTQDPQVVPRQT